MKNHEEELQGTKEEEQIGFQMELKNITNELKELAKFFDIPVITAQQLNRDADQVKSNINNMSSESKEEKMNFIERYSCLCGRLQGKLEEGNICDICRTKVKYVNYLSDKVAFITFLKVVKSTITINIHDSKTHHFIGRIPSHDENDDGKYLSEFINIFNCEILFREIRDIKIFVKKGIDNTILVFLEESESNRPSCYIKKYIMNKELLDCYKINMDFTINGCELFVKTVGFDKKHQQLKVDYTLNKQDICIDNNHISVEDLLISVYNRYVDNYVYGIEKYCKDDEKSCIDRLVKFSLDYYSSSEKMKDRISLESFLKSADSFLYDIYSGIIRTDCRPFKELENNSKHFTKSKMEKISSSTYDDIQTEKNSTEILFDNAKKDKCNEDDLCVYSNLKHLLNLFKNMNTDVPNSINDNIPLGLILSMIERYPGNKKIKIKVYQNDKLILNYKAGDVIDTFSTFLKYECFNVINIYSFKEYLINEVLDAIVIHVDNNYIDYLSPLNLTVRKFTLMTKTDSYKMMLNYMKKSYTFTQYVQYITLINEKLHAVGYHSINSKEESNKINKHLIFLRLYQLYCAHLDRLKLYSDQYKKNYVNDTIELMLLFETEYRDLTEENFEKFVLPLDEMNKIEVPSDGLRK